MTDKISDAALHEVMEAAREPVPKSHPARFRAWQEYCNKVDANWIPHDHEAARAAFVAVGKRANALSIAEMQVE